MTTTTPAPVLEELTATEAIRLMAGVPVGRVVFTEGALPAIRPVHFFVETRDAAETPDAAEPADDAEPPAGTAIVFRVIGDRNLGATLHKAVVAFQADESDMKRLTGWTVTATGHATRVDNATELDRLSRRLPLPWADGGIIFRVEPELVTGRRLSR